MDATLDELRTSVQGVQHEFDDHLNAINENTLEIKENYERILGMDDKIEKIASKLETTYMMVSELMKLRNRFQGVTLSDNEQKVFLALYIEDKSISLATLSKRINMKRGDVRLALNAMKKKEIPFFMRKESDDNYIVLEPRFKELQTREQLIKIDEKNQKNLFTKDLTYFF